MDEIFSWICHGWYGEMLNISVFFPMDDMFFQKFGSLQENNAAPPVAGSQVLLHAAFENLVSSGSYPFLKKKSLQAIPKRPEIDSRSPFSHKSCLGSLTQPKCLCMRWMEKTCGNDVFEIHPNPPLNHGEVGGKSRWRSRNKLQFPKQTTWKLFTVQKPLAKNKSDVWSLAFIWGWYFSPYTCQLSFSAPKKNSITPLFI